MKKVVLIFKYALMTMLLLSCVISLTAQSENSFKTIKIGEQVWMAKNLNVVNFRNGDLIPQAKTNEEWLQAAKERKPAWSYYNNNPDNGDRYGKLYNWYAVNDPRGLAPEGWKVPSFDDMTVLIEYIDSNLAGFFDDNKTGRIMKSTSGWVNNGNGTNESDFSALPGGWRYAEGSFFSVGEDGHWWSSTGIDVVYAWALRLDHDGDHVIRIGKFKGDGLSVRCFR